MPTLVSIDIETTGLDPHKDVIIEIGAVKFNERRVESEFSTLINPQRPIPREITQLTGISSEMVLGAPRIVDIIDELAAFVGDFPVIAHNVRFDLSFLQKHQILLENEAIDTYELASILLPTASRYNLEALGELQGIYVRESHRALEDARTTQQLFVSLYEKALHLPYEFIEEMVRLAEPIKWDGDWFFRQLMQERINEVFSAGKSREHFLDMLTSKNHEAFLAPLVPVDNPVPLDLDEVSSLLEFGGPFSRYFENYEYRSQQLEMLQVVANAISNSQHLMVEAGTGTGKSYAYLIPAALWAMQNGLRVVISTNTINLQDQLIKKDIPDLCAALDLNLRSAVLKGRNNYLCPRRMDSFRSRGPETADEIRVLGKIMAWLLEGGSGDRNEINLNGPIEREIWNTVSADDEGCKVEMCVSRLGGACPFYRAHQAAQSAHLIIVNHALLLADIATGSRILPEYEYLILDEAHHIEAATTNALSYRVIQPLIVRILRELGGTSSGILGHLLSLLRGLLPPSDYAAIDQVVRRMTDLAFRLEHDFREYFQALSDFMAEARDHHELSPYGQQTRIIPAARKLPIWEQIEIVWNTTDETLKLLLNLLSQLYNSVGQINHLTEEAYDALDSLGNQYRRLKEVQEQITGFTYGENEGTIYWCEISPNGSQIALEMAPLHIGSLMEKFLWHEKSCIILTSATLTTHTGFDYLRNRLNAETADEYMLGSPFDYESSALLYLVNDIPEPSDRNRYQRSVDQIIMRLAKATGGRMLVLFTSYAQLRQTAQTVTPYLQENGISVYEQGKGASPNVLLENFRSAEKAVLLGTRSFWEGVDIPGEALSVLLIVRLPFDVPSDPVIAARSELFEDSFHEYNLPEAVLRFRQGFGRLIRTQYDRGVVVVLDRRVISKSYGRAFIDALPQCTLKTDSMQNLVKSAVSWLNL